MLAESFPDSRDDAADMIRMRWYTGSWGSVMDGIEQTPGVWLQKRREVPYRLYPKAPRIARTRRP